MLNRISLLFLFFVSISCQAQHQKSKLLTQDEFKKGIASKNVQLIDVRTPEEFDAGHIKNAKNIDYMNSNFKSEIAKLDKSKPVYVYCQAGGRSAKAANMFVEAGFKDIHDLKGGYGSWKE